MWVGPSRGGMIWGGCGRVAAPAGVAGTGPGVQRTGRGVRARVLRGDRRHAGPAKHQLIHARPIFDFVLMSGRPIDYSDPAAAPATAMCASGPGKTNPSCPLSSHRTRNGGPPSGPSTFKTSPRRLGRSNTALSTTANRLFACISSSLPERPRLSGCPWSILTPNETAVPATSG